MMRLSNWITFVFGILSLILGAVNLTSQNKTFDFSGYILQSSTQHAVIFSAAMVQFGLILAFHALLGIFVATSYHKSLLSFYEVLSGILMAFESRDQLQLVLHL